MELSEIKDPDLANKINELILEYGEEEDWNKKPYNQRFKEFCKDFSTPCGRESWYKHIYLAQDIRGSALKFNCSEDAPCFMRGSRDVMMYKYSAKYVIFSLIIDRYLRAKKFTCVSIEQYRNYIFNEHYALIKKLKEKYYYGGPSLCDLTTPQFYIDESSSNAHMWIKGKKVYVEGKAKIKMIQWLWAKANKINLPS